MYENNFANLSYCKLDIPSDYALMLRELYYHVQFVTNNKFPSISAITYKNENFPGIVDFMFAFMNYLCDIYTFNTFNLFRQVMQAIKN